MRIAFIAPYVSNRAGPARVIANLIDKLCEDHQITVFAHAVEGIRLTNVKHCKVPGAVSNKLLGYVVWLISSTLFMAIFFLFRKKRYDIIHSQTYLGAFSADVITSHFCERECLRLEKNHTIQIPRRGIWQRFKALDDSLYRRLMVFAEKAAFGRKTNRARVVVSQRMKEDFIRNYGDSARDILVIPNGVSLEAFTPATKQLWRDSVRKKHGIAGNDLLLLFAGGDWERKGLRYVIEALSLLQRSDVRLLISGRGDERFYSQLAASKEVSDRIAFVSSSADICQYYGASDVFVFPTLYEPFGLVILEAMASGLPVITSRVAGAAEFMNDGDDCLLLDDPADAGAIADKINLLLSDHELRNSMGRRARITAEKLSWEMVAEKTLQVYNSVLERKKGQVFKNAERLASG